MEVYNECRSVLGNTFFSCIFICFEKVGGAMTRTWVILKHALGSFDEEDGYNIRNENAIGIIRFLIVITNLLCAVFIMANVVHNW
jgi:hypothetical protein